MKSKWYLAELVMKITVADDPRNVVHQNLVLIKAGSAAKAHKRALDLGKKQEISYANPYGKIVRFSFEGLSGLDLIDEELEDGAEIAFHSTVNVPDEQLRMMLVPRDRLHVFLPPTQAEGPNYASGEVLALLGRGSATRRLSSKRRVPHP